MKYSTNDISDKYDELAHHIYKAVSYQTWIGVKFISNPNLPTMNFRFHDRGWFRGLEKIMQQFMINTILHIICAKLEAKDAGLFDIQKKMRNKKEKILMKVGIIPWNKLKQISADEENMASEISTFKNFFHSIFSLAKELGFNVIEVKSDQYKYYSALHVSYSDIALNEQI